jgi:hypothetical protein
MIRHPPEGSLCKLRLSRGENSKVYYAFGKDDVVIIVDLPANASRRVSDKPSPPAAWHGSAQLASSVEEMDKGPNRKPNTGPGAAN